MSSRNLVNHLLIAMPHMADPNFSETITYICEHSDEEGSLGVIINRPIELTLGELALQLQLPASASASHILSQPVLEGGPVERDRGFVIHEDDGREWDSSVEIGGGMCMTSSRDILKALVMGEAPDSSLVALGYAGWGPGQLESELADNAWLLVEATPELLFGTPYHQRWNAAAHHLGVELNLLPSFMGHC